MKNILLVIFIVGMSLNLSAQEVHPVDWYNWSNPITYKLSPRPFITGYGFYSDSLSQISKGATFYEANGEYYQIDSWADYYFWYVNKYWYQFTNPELYEYYYSIKDDFQMASYIAGRSYKGPYYPSEIYLVFHGKQVAYNRLNKNSKYIASNERQIRRFNKTMERTRAPIIKHPEKDKSNVGKKEYLVKDVKRNEFIGHNYKPIKREVTLNNYEQNRFIGSPVYRKSISNNTTRSNYNHSSGTTNKHVSKLPKQK